jgi:serine protease AprX
MRPASGAWSLGLKLFGLAILVLTLNVGSVAAAAPTSSSAKNGLSAVLAANKLSATVRGIATFDSVPTRAEVRSLRGLGLTVQPMHSVSLAIVQGKVSAMSAAVANGLANDVYPDDPIKLLDSASSNSMGGAALRANGFTGKGVTVAVVDSGCDASHPDLADHVIHNVILSSPEYVNGRPNSSNTIVVANETGPYQNTDIGSGHGTHVAGIIAADSSSVTDGSRFGVAPDAKLVCYAIGLVLTTTAVVTAYDHMLSQPNHWGIDVVNNSWGNSYRMFDPLDPVSVITKAVASQGVAVVFAAGNSGTAEMSLNPFSEAPWVISVAASSVDYKLAGFSSRGLAFDNSVGGYLTPGTAAANRMTYTGDRIGLYHPDVTAPGDKIQSTCDTAGTAVGPCAPGENTEASGTSMASPHIAGAAAVLLQANPKLTYTQVRQAFQATARQLKDKDGKSLSFWEQGYGFVQLDKAVALVRAADWKTRLASLSAKADARVLASDGFRVKQSDFWQYNAPAATAGGTDSGTYKVDVAKGVTYLKVSLSHPSLAVVGFNGTEYSVTVKDAAGKVIGTGTEAGLLDGAGTNSTFVDFSKVAGGVKFGTFTVEISGTYAASDPDTLDSDSLLGRVVVLQVAQLTKG